MQRRWEDKLAAYVDALNSALRSGDITGLQYVSFAEADPGITNTYLKTAVLDFADVIALDPGTSGAAEEVAELAASLFRMGPGPQVLVNAALLSLTPSELQTAWMDQNHPDLVFAPSTDGNATASQVESNSDNGIEINRTVTYQASEFGPPVQVPGPSNYQREALSNNDGSISIVLGGPTSSVVFAYLDPTTNTIQTTTIPIAETANVDISGHTVNVTTPNGVTQTYQVVPKLDSETNLPAGVYNQTNLPAYVYAEEYGNDPTAGAFYSVGSTNYIAVQPDSTAGSAGLLSKALTAQWWEGKVEQALGPTPSPSLPASSSSGDTSTVSTTQNADGTSNYSQTDMASDGSVVDTVTGKLDDNDNFIDLTKTSYFLSATGSGLPDIAQTDSYSVTPGIGSTNDIKNFSATGLRLPTKSSLVQRQSTRVDIGR